MAVQEFFKNKNIFMTGGSGYVGKALIEKLLRSCPDVGNIYLLLRTKKLLKGHDRIKQILDTAIFDNIRLNNPQQFKKLIPINGNIADLELGLSEEDKKELTENVHIVVHSAASIRFDDSLKNAVLLNTRSTRETINLSLKMKHVQAFVYVSTAFTNIEHKTVEEHIYPVPVSWRDAIEMVENTDNGTMEILTQKYISPHPNTYTFTKLLAESLVQDMCLGRVPALILRPSIVYPAVKEPIPGWVDNFNGPIGVMIGGGLGVLRLFYGDMDSPKDGVPIDFVVRTILLATYTRGLNKNLSDLPVYNCCLGNELKLTTRLMTTMGSELSWIAPMCNLVWYPDYPVYRNYCTFYISFIFRQLLPALLIDMVLRLLGKRPRFLKLAVKLFVTITSLAYFSFNSWSFQNRNTLRLDDDLDKNDIELFTLQPYLHWDRNKIFDYYKTTKIAVHGFLLETEYDKEKGLKRTWRLYVLDRFVKILLSCLFCWIFFTKTSVVAIINDTFNKYYKR